MGLYLCAIPSHCLLVHSSSPGVYVFARCIYWVYAVSTCRTSHLPPGIGIGVPRSLCMDQTMYGPKNQYRCHFNGSYEFFQRHFITLLQQCVRPKSFGKWYLGCRFLRRKCSVFPDSSYFCISVLCFSSRQERP